MQLIVCLLIIIMIIFSRLAGGYAGSSGQLQYHRQRTQTALQHAERRRRIVGKPLKMSENSCRALGLQGVVSFTAFGDRWACLDLWSNQALSRSGLPRYWFTVLSSEEYWQNIDCWHTPLWGCCHNSFMFLDRVKYPLETKMTGLCKHFNMTIRYEARKWTFWSACVSLACQNRWEYDRIGITVFESKQI